MCWWCTCQSRLGILGDLEIAKSASFCEMRNRRKQKRATLTLTKGLLCFYDSVEEQTFGLDYSGHNKGVACGNFVAKEVACWRLHDRPEAAPRPFTFLHSFFLFCLCYANMHLDLSIYETAYFVYAVGSRAPPFGCCSCMAKLIACASQ